MITKDQNPDAMSALTSEELRRLSDSTIENIGALRFSIGRIEYYEEQLPKLRSALQEALGWISEDAPTAIRIRDLLKDTETK